jgi:hypothetical protein
MTEQTEQEPSAGRSDPESRCSAINSDGHRMLSGEFDGGTVRRVRGRVTRRPKRARSGVSTVRNSRAAERPGTNLPNHAVIDVRPLHDDHASTW